MTWTLKSFTELSSHELYAILKLRTAVFVIEQNCVFQDMDDKDAHCMHLMGFSDGILAAYSRLVPAGSSYAEAAIGRIAVDGRYRAQGFGKALVQLSVDKIYELYGRQSIRIGAQCYLNDFYQTLGFENSSDEYLEDGIPHIEMLLR